ncbi:GTPase ObgE [Patescibacteria group bacterium]|nr:MAG: GTPase ObgE [Patescibacteria group bacterium]
MFADTAKIIIQAGKGGDGRLSFRREKYRAMGGPDGGDGGDGGSVIFEVSHNVSTLSAFRRKQRIEAEAGQVGGDNRKRGKGGEDMVVPVPEGTQVYDGEQLIADLTAEQPRVVIAKGGKGGYGNAHFVSSVRQAPRIAEKGEPGHSFEARLELKSVADVGLIGLPNAGKSTLLSVTTGARPEIGNYAFTTITPNLGVASWRDSSFTIADIPGLIEGAHQGKGLGDEFLRHIERTAVLVHLIDVASQNVAQDYKLIQEELGQYQVDLSGKPQLVALSKIDTVADAKQVKQAETALKKAGVKQVFQISSTTHTGLNELLDAVLKLVEADRQRRDQEVAEKPKVIIDEASQPDLWSVEKADNGFIVHGEKIERFARRTNWDSDIGVDRIKDILRRQGVVKELLKQGLTEGMVIHIADYQLTWE